MAPIQDGGGAVGKQLKFYIVLIVLACIYFIAGKLGLKLAYNNPSATAVWAPTGIAFAALLYYGYWVWPAIFIAAFFVNLTTTHAIVSSIAIAMGNTLEGVVGAYLINQYAGGKLFFERTDYLKRFALFAAVLAPAISATIGVASLIITHHAQMQSAAPVWLTWWVGDAVGAIIMTPLLLLLASKKFKKLTGDQIIERVAFLFIVFGVSTIIFRNIFANHPLEFLLIPLLVWPGLRFSQRESAITTFLVASIAIWATVSGIGPFVIYYPQDSLLMLQAYIAIISLTSLFIAAAVAERQDAQVKLSEAYEKTLEGWSRALDLRDKATEGHSRRVASLAVFLAKAAGISGPDLDNIRWGALLHDIGKVALPDSVLFKPESLSGPERDLIQQHPLYAYELLSGIPYLKEAIQIPYCHHEKWDGTGYPRKLKGLEIPLSARIFSIVDVYDALRSERPYRPEPWSEEKTIEYLQSLSGTHFDPELLQIFIKVIKQLELHPTSNQLALKKTQAAV